METSDFTLIEKEDVAGLHFPSDEILHSDSKIAERLKEVDRAISLGNLEHYKVKIYFADDLGQKVVHTTIWAVTDKSIVLKQNVVIPTHRIIKLEI